MSSAFITAAELVREIEELDYDFKHFSVQKITSILHREGCQHVRERRLLFWDFDQAIGILKEALESEQRLAMQRLATQRQAASCSSDGPRKAALCDPDKIYPFPCSPEVWRAVALEMRIERSKFWGGAK